MIVLRIDVRGHSADVRWSDGEAVLGSGPEADIRREDAGWAPREALLVRTADAVVLVHVASGQSIRLGRGDGAVLGDARVTLEGLAPETGSPIAHETTDELEPPETSARADEWTRSSAPIAAGTNPFRLDGETAAQRDLRPATPPPPAAAPSLRMETGEAPRSAAPVPPPPTPSPAPAPAPPAHPHVAKDRWGVATFDDDMVGALKKSPWFVLSAAIHGLALLLLLVLGPTSRLKPPPPPEHYGLQSMTVPVEDPLESGGPTEPDPEQPPEEVTAPEIADVADPPRPMDPLLTPLPEPTPNSDTPLVELQPDDAMPPPTIGPSQQAISSRVATRFSTSPPKTEKGEDLDHEHAYEMNRRAAAHVRDQIAKGGGALGRLLRGLRADHILVVRGAYDHMELVLEELGIPFTQASPHALLEDHDWSKHKAVFWNCGMAAYRPAERQRVAGAVREFVRGGGYLFTTDWALDDVLIPAFPGLLETTRNRVTLPELVLDVTVAPGASDHPLLEGVVLPDEPMRWWLEQAAHDVRVLAATRVTVLLEAPELGRSRWNRGSAIAITFTEGRGRVLHVVGHHYQQKSNFAGAVGAQRLPLNFLRARLEGDAPR